MSMMINLPISRSSSKFEQFAFILFIFCIITVVEI